MVFSVGLVIFGFWSLDVVDLVWVWSVGCFSGLWVCYFVGFGVGEFLVLGLVVDCLMMLIVRSAFWIVFRLEFAGLVGVGLISEYGL